jgi:hypothetical protein
MTHPSLEIDRPAFVQPEVLPGSIGDKVTTPAVGKLMSNDIDVFPVLILRLILIIRRPGQLKSTLEMILGVAKVKIGFSMPP